MNRARTVRDPGERLAAAIVAHGIAAGCPSELVSIDRREWASATFVGWWLRIVLAVAPGPERDPWLAGLAEAGFALPRFCLADLAIVDDVAGAPQVTIEMLLLNDG